MPQLFDPATFSPEQAAILINTPGQSLTATNSASTIQGAQAMNPSPNIPAYMVSPTNQFKTADTTATPDYNAILASTKQAETQVNSDQQAVLDAMHSLGNQSADLAGFQDAAGVNVDKKAILDLQASLNALNNEAMAQNVRLGNQPILTSIATGQQAEAEKLRAIKAMSISSQIQAAQGNLSLAQDQADRALALKYDPIKNQIDTLTKQLDYNYKRLDGAQKVQADALKLQLENKKTQITEQHATDKKFSDMKVTALSNQMPLSIAQQAQKLYDTGQADQAYALMSHYTGTQSLDKNTSVGDGNDLFSSVLQQSIDAGLSPQESVLQAQNYAKTNNISIPYSKLGELFKIAKGMTPHPSQPVQDQNSGIGGFINSLSDKIHGSWLDPLTWFK
jgi:hypothetical protein